MSSEPQFAKFPNLRVAQSIFTITTSPASSPARAAALIYLQDAIKEHKMAPLYRHLAHPTEGVLNQGGESGSSAAAVEAAGAAQGQKGSEKRRASLVASNLVPVNRKALMEGGVGNGAEEVALVGWDEKLYEELKQDNERELEEIQKEEDEAEEKAGETEVQAARSKRADFWARVGDKVCSQYLSRGSTWANVFVCRIKRSHRSNRCLRRVGRWGRRLILYWR
jgi:26S proteasome regulatory subunit N7